MKRLPILLLIGLFRILSERRAIRLGAWLGRLVFHLDRRHRQIAFDNLKQSFGQEHDDVWLWTITRRSFEQLGRTLAEVTRLEQTDPVAFRRRVKIEGYEHYRAALNEKKGVMLISAHFGNWEWIGATLALAGHPVALVARALDDAGLNAILNAARERHGNTVLNKKTAASEIVRRLRTGETVGILIDQNTRAEDAVFVDYFGRSAATHKGPAVIALRTGAKVVPVFVIREGDHNRLVIRRPLEVTKTGDLQRDIHNLTALFTQTVESHVRQYPDHWLWIHRRWKTRPRTGLTGSSR
jgi:KDO2-lipid IV(A) lauroyltransferase